MKVLQVTLTPPIDTLSDLIYCTNAIGLNIYDIITVSIDYGRLCFLKNKRVIIPANNTSESSTLNELIKDVTPLGIALTFDQYSLLRSLLFRFIHFISHQLEMLFVTISRADIKRCTTKITSLHPNKIEFKFISYVN